MIVSRQLVSPMLRCTAGEESLGRKSLGETKLDTANLPAYDCGPNIQEADAMSRYKFPALLVVCLSLAVSFTLLAPYARAAHTFTTIDVPGSGETDCNDFNTPGPTVAFSPV